MAIPGALGAMAVVLPSLISAPCPPQEQAIALTLLFSSFLLPTAWVLANIHHYRSRPE